MSEDRGRRARHAHHARLRRVGRVGAAAALALVLGASGAGAQGAPDRLRGARYERAGSEWTSELAFVGGNAALGGLTAGLARAVRGGSFWAGVRRGALGGAIAYAGKRIAAEPFDGAGLLGREVAAVGSSIVRNASNGRPALDELVLPIGVVRLYTRQDSASPGRRRTRVKLDVATLLVAGYVAMQPHARFDPGASLSAGMPVFESVSEEPDRGWVGIQAAGVIWLRGDAATARESTARPHAVLAHERIHALQYDFSFLVWSAPIEGWLSRRIPGGAWMDDHLDLGLHLAGWELVNQLIAYPARPWEQEAHFLSRRLVARE